MLAVLSLSHINGDSFKSVVIPKLNDCTMVIFCLVLHLASGMCCGTPQHMLLPPPDSQDLFIKPSFKNLGQKLGPPESRLNIPRQTATAPPPDFLPFSALTYPRSKFICDHGKLSSFYMEELWQKGGDKGRHRRHGITRHHANKPKGFGA